jgi:hypothetical protein
MEDRLSSGTGSMSHKLDQGDRVHNLHELSKSANVSEGKGRTKAFPDFLCKDQNL